VLLGVGELALSASFVGKGRLNPSVAPQQNTSLVEAQMKKEL
jgi:hypothetical protein